LKDRSGKSEIRILSDFWMLIISGSDLVVLGPSGKMQLRERVGIKAAIHKRWF